MVGSRTGDRASEIRLTNALDWAKRSNPASWPSSTNSQFRPIETTGTIGNCESGHSHIPTRGTYRELAVRSVIGVFLARGNAHQFVVFLILRG